MLPDRESCARNAPWTAARMEQSRTAAVGVSVPAPNQVWAHGQIWLGVGLHLLSEMYLIGD